MQCFCQNFLWHRSGKQRCGQIYMVTLALAPLWLVHSRCCCMISRSLFMKMNVLLTNALVAQSQQTTANHRYLCCSLK